MAVTIFVTLAIRKATSTSEWPPSCGWVVAAAVHPSGERRGLDPKEASVNVGQDPAGGGLADQVIERGEVHAGAANLR